MSTGKLLFEKKIIASGILYFLISGILLYKYGIQLGGEAEKYIDNANRILNNQGLRNGVFGIFYFSYSVIVAFFIKLSLNLLWIAVMQIVLSFTAAFFLYKMLYGALQKKSTAFLIFCAYLLCYPVQKWNFFLYSESFHSSLLVIGIYLFHRAITFKNSRAWLAFILLIPVIVFSRPVGIIFLFTVTAVMINWFYRNNKKIMACWLSLGCVVALVGTVYSPLAAFINPDSIRRMEIICQVPETKADVGYTEFNRQGLYQAFKVIKDEIGAGSFLKTGVKKWGYFFGMTRNYYSWYNNLFLMLFWFVYPLTLLGIFSASAPAYYYIKWTAVLYLALTSVAIFFTCDDWANRFISAVFPFILILAAGGIVSFNKWIKSILIAKLNRNN